MRTACAILLVIVITTLLGDAQAQVPIGNLTAFRMQGETATKVPIIVGHDAGSGAIYLTFDDLISKNKVQFRPEARDTLAVRLTKFLEWNQKAIQQGVEINKRIGDFWGNLLWQMEGMWDGRDEVMGVVGFYSVSKDAHYATLHFNDVKVQGLFFTQDQVQQFLKMLVPELEDTPNPDEEE